MCASTSVDDRQSRAGRRSNSNSIRQHQIKSQTGHRAQSRVIDRARGAAAPRSRARRDASIAVRVARARTFFVDISASRRRVRPRARHTMTPARAPPSPFGDAVSEVYERCAQLREVVRASAPSVDELTSALDAVERSSRALTGASAAKISREALDAVRDAVQGAMELGERAVWDLQLGSASDAKETKAREALRELDQWAEAAEENRRERRTMGKLGKRPANGVVELSSRRVGAMAEAEVEAETRNRLALAELERRFPQPRRGGTAANGDDERREVGKKRREEVLLQIDSTLASMAEEAAEVGANVGVQTQSKFLRVGIGIAICLTFFAIMLIEYLVEESTTSNDLVVTQLAMPASPNGA